MGNGSAQFARKDGPKIGVHCPEWLNFDAAVVDNSWR
jgi:hypothetical protein